MQNNFFVPLIAVLMCSCASVANSDYSFTPGGENAMLVTHHDNSRTTLVPVDLETKRVVAKPIIIGREFGTVFQYSKDRLTKYHLNELKYLWPMPSKGAGFDPNLIPQGTYAYVGTKFSYLDQLASVYASTIYINGCFPDGAYIIDINSNNINFLDRIGTFLLRQEIGDEADNGQPDPVLNVNQSKNELDRLKFTLEEFPLVKGDVVRPKVIGKVKFLKEKGCNVQAGEIFEILE